MPVETTFDEVNNINSSPEKEEEESTKKKNEDKPREPKKNDEIEETPKPKAEKESKKSPKANKNKILSIFLIIIVLILLGLSGVLVYQYLIAPNTGDDENTKTTEIQDDDVEDERDAEEVEDDDSDDQDEEVADEEVENENLFEGAYLSAEIPEGWSIVEYLDGSNDEILTEGVVYTGLTGFAVVDETSTEVFEANGAWGIGGVGYCEKYYQFAEYNITHYTEKVTLNTEIGEAAPVLIDMTAETYSEYEVLGTLWRRVDDKFYWDQDDTNAFFEPACNLLSMASPSYDGLDFDADGYSVTTYMSEILLDPADVAKLDLLDGVLESLAVL